MIPASIQAWAISQLSVFQHSVSPQELLTRRGRLLGSRLDWVRSQGASMKSSAGVISSLPDEPPLGKTLALIHFAPGATPIWLVWLASSPRIVPIVCEPCEP